MPRPTPGSFNSEIDAQIIRGYFEDREAMFRLLEERHDLGRASIIKRAATLGLTERTIEQYQLSDTEHAPRECLRCGRVFVSQGPGNRLCRKCLRAC